MDRPRALVIGGSLGGLFAANLLRSVGWDAVVFERAPGDLSGRGAGLGTRGELAAVIRRLGIVLKSDVEVELRSRIALDQDGRSLCELPISSKATAWDRVYRLLKGALPAACYRARMQMVNFHQSANSVTAQFRDGSTVPGDLLIAADGIHSTARALLIPQIRPQYAGYLAWRGVVPERLVPERIRELVFNHMVFSFPEGEMALGVPMANSDEDKPERRVQLSWFRPAQEAALMEMCTDKDGRQHGFFIPPPSIRTELLDSMRADAKNRLPPQLARLAAGMIQPILQPIFDFETPMLVFGRVLLLGDAAFVARPHIGTGVTKAALDAQCLADVLAANGHLEAALRQYECERRRAGAALVDRGRYLGAYLGAQIKPPWMRSPEESSREPEIVMREFGAAGTIDRVPSLPA